MLWKERERGYSVILLRNPPSLNAIQTNLDAYETFQPFVGYEKDFPAAHKPDVFLEGKKMFKKTSSSSLFLGKM